MRVAVFGGSFNPPHLGHALVAGWLGWTERADEVWLVPTYSHAFHKALAPFSRRVRLCEAMASQVGAWVRVCDVESELPAPSYTIDTLRELQHRHPHHSFRLVVGADVLGQTASWRDWEGISRDYSPVVVGRGGWPAVADAPTFPEVSSTDIRERLAQGRPVDHLVPARVLALIEEWGEAW